MTTSQTKSRAGIPTKPNRTGKATAADSVMTPPHIAKLIVAHYKPTGVCLEPCRGTGNIYAALPDPKDWCEISQGRDFFDYERKVDWIITNPPFSIFDRFIEHCFDLAENVVLLCPVAKAHKSLTHMRRVEEYGGLREMWVMGGGGVCGFAFGFPVGCLYYQRGYTGKIDYLFTKEGTTSV